MKEQKPYLTNREWDYVLKYKPQSFTVRWGDPMPHFINKQVNSAIQRAKAIGLRSDGEPARG